MFPDWSGTCSHASFKFTAFLVLSVEPVFVGIAVHGAKVQEFQGRKSLGISFTGSYEIQPEVAEVDDLVV